MVSIHSAAGSRAGAPAAKGLRHQRLDSSLEGLIRHPAFTPRGPELLDVADLGVRTALDDGLDGVSQLMMV